MKEKQDHESLRENRTGVSSGIAARILKIILPIVIIISGIAAYSYLKKTGPTTQRRPPATFAPVVEVKPLYPQNHRTVIKAMGTVVPEQTVELRSRVSGEIIEIHPEFSEGGLLKAGSKIIQIDPVDYELALSQKKKTLADAEYEIKLELGRQAVAKKEWQLLNLEMDATEREIELALRKPHLEKARAAVTAAEAEVEKARLDLSRTQIIAPFNAMVRTRHVNVGSQVTTQQPLAELVGTDAYWIQASVPIERLSWIQIPQRHEGGTSSAEIIYSGGFKLSGNVVRLMGDLSQEGRMARVLIHVNDPLGLQKQSNAIPPLLIGDFVQVKIEGSLLENVYQIPRTALRDNTFIWIVNENSSLKIKEVETVWRETDTVVIKDGVKPGDLLVLTNLSAPVEGMPVQVNNFISENILPEKEPSSLFSETS